MPRRERCEAKSTVERIEAKDSVLNKRGILFDPTLWPSPSERVLELIGYEVGRMKVILHANPIDCARDRGRSNNVHKPHHAKMSEDSKKKATGSRCNQTKDSLIGNSTVDKQSNRLIQPEIGSDYADCGNGKSNAPNPQRRIKLLL